MATTPYKKVPPIPYAPTDASDLYPAEDGKPMAVSDYHRRILMRTIQVLEEYFAQRPEVYVSGDILMYYVKGNPRKSVSPDVLVSFGLGNKLRRTYLVWEEGKVPDFAMEFSSKGTYRNDLSRKKELYASLGIQDYFLYDAEGLYLPTALMGFTLVDGVYVPISPVASGGLHSPSLGLDFHVDNDGLGIYDPVADKWLQTPAESASARAEREANRAEEEAERAEQEANRAEEEAERAEREANRAEEEAERAEREANRAEEEAERAEREANRAEKAEAEVAQLREELARLQAHRK